jgi:PAS domain S-box-containing protein
VGGLPALCIVVTDLTEIFAATETRLRLASIVETSNDAIISKSLDDTILTWNAAAERIFGFSAQEAVGQPVSIIVSPDRLQESKMIDEKAYLGQRIEGYETTRSTKSGASIEISLTVSRLMEANGKVTGISIIARDITERKRAKDALLQARDRLEERVAKRTHELDATNKALESYSHSVSHDLRTPLRFVNRITHMLLHDPEANLSNAAVQQVNMILQATGEMAKLIEKLLVFSQVSRETIIKNRVDLRRLFQGVVKELRHVQVDRSVDIVIQNLAPCHGDRTLLKEVVANLLENAFKFTRRREIARITVGCTETTAETVYFVQDNGVGFDMSNADSLFVPFHRLHKPDDFEGTGIGLALVKRIIERHGGRVWAEGEVDKGATFYFTLGKETPEGYTTKLKEAND